MTCDVSPVAMFTYKKLNFWKYHPMKNSGFEINRDPWPETLSAESTKHVRRVSLLNIVKGPGVSGVRPD